MDVAGALLKIFAPELRTAISIRHSGQPVTISHVVNEELMQHLSRVVRNEVKSVEPGTVAVIVPGEEKRVYLDGLTQSGLDALARPDARLAVLSIDEAKGLEFDSVVISGADHLLSSSSLNLQALFVAMTRTTNRLVFVHNRDVPGVIVDLLSQQKSGTGKEKPNIYYSANRG
jgi:DNA helicase IV